MLCVSKYTIKVLISANLSYKKSCKSEKKQN